MEVMRLTEMVGIYTPRYDMMIFLIGYTRLILEEGVKRKAKDDRLQYGTIETYLKIIII
jgi:hypothetical protein